MKQATLPLYIRFGEIPDDEQSKVHRSDKVVRKEGGVSVWRACKTGNLYFPVLPEDANQHAIMDYFNYLLSSSKRVYLVTGTEIDFEGADREPLLIDVQVIKEITHYYRNTKEQNQSPTVETTPDMPTFNEIPAVAESRKIPNVDVNIGDLVKIVRGSYKNLQEPHGFIKKIEEPYTGAKLYKIASVAIDPRYQDDPYLWVSAWSNEIEPWNQEA